MPELNTADKEIVSPYSAHDLMHLRPDEDHPGVLEITVIEDWVSPYDCLTTSQVRFEAEQVRELRDYLSAWLAQREGSNG